MSVETGWDPWRHEHLIIAERLTGANRFTKDFVLQGFHLAEGPGLELLVGQSGLNAGYVNGYELVQENSVSKILLPNTTNHVFLVFTKVPDPIAGTVAIAVSDRKSVV